MFRDRCTGATWEIDTAQQLVLVSLAWQGAWSEMAARLPRLVAEGRERGDLYAETLYTLGVGYVPRLAADDPAGAERLLREGLAAWSRPRFGVQQYYYTFALAEVHLYAERGRGPLAERHLAGAWPELDASMLLVFQLPWVEMHYARFRALVELAAWDGAGDGERRGALSHAERIARRLGRVRVAWASGFAQLSQATLAALGARREEALGLLASAAEAFDAAEMALYAAAARRRRGELLGGAEGAALVERADAWIASQGALEPARVVAMLAPGRWGGG